MQVSHQTEELTEWYDGPAADIRGWYYPGDEARPVLHFLHGNGFCARTLWPLARRLSDGGSVLLTDLPGHGGSAQPAHRMPDWVAMAERVGDALETRRGNQPVIGIGHSMGGVITLLLAARRPHLFQRIILLDPVLFSPEVVFYQRLARKSGLWKRSRLVKSVSNRRRQWGGTGEMWKALKDKSLYRNWSDEAFENFVRGGTNKGPDGISLACSPLWEASIFGSYPRGLWQAVHQISVRTDILVASDSYGFIARSARKASAANANIHWQNFEGGHCFPMEQADKTADVLAQMLSA
ncbi:MAG: hypothetical protein CMI08_07800 [Oceanospirillaceae bacterium]|uniref:alpha/beta hydrolase n=1 Tax=Thalassolituus sp. UBA6592 TaxID=1947665 RepID=UPI000C5A9D47|nr:alpha/beta hydrolase [Thalassolituus sp. UBA6592]MAS24975.1 hypothetical protein [Oceanospirillaceae bacterium]MAX99095.1 hypothetical protein [Oceanospirillaceae bacterium]MBS53188.1 hypothetical protein [Oceanospirillaceae bacterium]|tara:strand:+ start:374 stop:1258 length:885 start_codon:yes stop_codon:yes gene_type:complete